MVSPFCIKRCILIIMRSREVEITLTFIATLLPRIKLTSLLASFLLFLTLPGVFSLPILCPSLCFPCPLNFFHINISNCSFSKIGHSPRRSDCQGTREWTSSQSSLDGLWLNGRSKVLDFHGHGIKPIQILSQWFLRTLLYLIQRIQGLLLNSVRRETVHECLWKLSKVMHRPCR